MLNVIQKTFTANSMSKVSCDVFSNVYCHRRTQNFTMEVVLRRWIQEFPKGAEPLGLGGRAQVPPKLNQYAKLVHNVGKMNPTGMEEKNTKTEKKVT